VIEPVWHDVRLHRQHEILRGYLLPGGGGDLGRHTAVQAQSDCESGVLLALGLLGSILALASLVATTFCLLLGP